MTNSDIITKEYVSELLIDEGLIYAVGISLRENFDRLVKHYQEKVACTAVDEYDAGYQAGKEETDRYYRDY